MSAMPAGWTELSESPRKPALPDRVTRRADRRAELKIARRSQRRWAIAASSILVVSFAFTVGMLELLH
ncbi:MAG TPA: hypothetical protein VIJ56_07860 [Acidimicrobiales bacterium]